MATKHDAKRQQEVPPTEFVSHHEDPMLTLTECGLLVGRTRQTIAKWIDGGLINAIRDPSETRRVRKSELVRFYGATALAEKNPILEEVSNG